MHELDSRFSLINEFLQYFQLTPIFKCLTKFLLCRYFTRPQLDHLSQIVHVPKDEEHFESYHPHLFSCFPVSD